MARWVSIQELRDATSSVVSELEAGQQLILTIGHRPIADIVPHARERSPWVDSSELRRIVREASADPDLLAGLTTVRDAKLDDA